MLWLKRIFYGIAGLLLAGWLAMVGYAYWPTGITEVPARTLADPGDQFVNVNGLELRYHSWGEPGPDKPVAVLLHGFGNSLQSFRLVAPLLATHYYVVAVDMPGYGLSAKPVDFDYQNPNQAQMMKDFIRALGLKNVVVGGHSLGGAIAFRVALDNPDVIGLVVMNPGIISTGVPPIARYIFFPMQRIQAKLFGDPEFRANFLRRSFIDPSIVTDEVVRNLSLTSQSEGYLAGMTSLMGQYNEADEVPMLPQLKVPALIVWGAQDRGKPAGEFEQLRELMPNNTAVLVPTSGHYVQEEAPVETAEAMKAFVPRVMPATP